MRLHDKSWICYLRCRSMSIKPSVFCLNSHHLQWKSKTVVDREKQAPSGIIRSQLQVGATIETRIHRRRRKHFQASWMAMEDATGVWWWVAPLCRQCQLPRSHIVCGWGSMAQCGLQWIRHQQPWQGTSWQPRDNRRLAPTSSSWPPN